MKLEVSKEIRNLVEDNQVRLRKAIISHQVSSKY